MKYLLLFLIVGCVSAVEYLPTYGPNSYKKHSSRSVYNLKVLAASKDRQYVLIKTDRVRLYKRKDDYVKPKTCRKTITITPFQAQRIHNPRFASRSSTRIR